MVASLVAWPRMTSTNCITGTGFMKCIPITFSGRRVRAPISVIEIELVFDARITSSAQTRSSVSNSENLSGGFSVAASTTKFAAAAASSAVAV